jgi:aldehyde dehydrogenase (NAD+)
VATPNRIYVDGSWIASEGTATIDVHDSTNGEVFATIAAGTAGDVDRAVEAARAAFVGWSARSVDERADLMAAAADALQERAGELAEIITRETGMPRWLSERIQVSLAVGDFRAAADVARSFTYEHEVGNSLIVHEPLGVVGCITPWNYPLHQIAAKVAYAMAAGCTVVVKPSEVAPLDALVLTEVLDGIGLPPGVFNLVTGYGQDVGEAIAAHPGVDLVSFTGSGRAGQRVAEVAARNVTMVALELGGKSANVLLDDLDDATFEKAVRAGVGNCYLNSGQTCLALTRMLVPRDRLAEAEAIAADEVARKFSPVDPFAERARLGPLSSAAQVERVTGFVRTGIEEGAKLVAGGPDRPEGVDPAGYYVAPTVFSEVRNDMRIAREEIFGPVLSILPYDSEEEAVTIANDTEYGLGGGVWSADPDRAHSVARRLRAGQVEINGGAFNPSAPFGGYKRSGYGREYGVLGFEEFLEVKALQR